jgi:hypothetical protein
MMGPLSLPLALLPLVLLTLSGCSAPAPARPEPPPEEPVEILALPETRHLEPLSAPGIVTEGREPEEGREPATPMGARDYHGNMMRWAYDNEAALLAEAPDAYFYALPQTEERPETALIRWGTSAAEFDWLFSTPRMYPLEMYRFDLDGDGEDELVVLCCSGSGTGVSVWDLHMVEKHEDGTLTDYSTFRYAEDGNPLWDDGLPSLLGLERIGDRAFLILGRELAEVDPAALPEEDRRPFTGSTIQFEVFPEERRIRFWGGVDVVPASYVADLSADVAYRDGVFTLSNFHLYGNTFFEERRP